MRHKLNNETRPHDRKAREALRSTLQPSLEASCLCLHAFKYIRAGISPLSSQIFLGLLLSLQCSAGHIKTQHTSSRPYAVGARNENCTA